MEIAKLNRIRIGLIASQIFFLAFLLVAEWTNLRSEIKIFFSLFEMNEWEKLFFYIPIIFILQSNILKAEIYYIFGLIWYFAIFLLEFSTFVMLLNEGFAGEIHNLNTNFNITIKLIEFVTLFLIMIFTLKTIKEK